MLFCINGDLLGTLDLLSLEILNSTVINYMYYYSSCKQQLLLYIKCFKKESSNFLQYTRGISYHQNIENSANLNQTP